MLDYETLRNFAASWGMLYFAALFVVAVAYALWPSKQQTFDKAARMPLSED
jgi:cytochrome c oxidase cbb3-type subunit IV